jgi:rubrerythrin
MEYSHAVTTYTGPDYLRYLRGVLPRVYGGTMGYYEEDLTQHVKDLERRLAERDEQLQDERTRRETLEEYMRHMEQGLKPARPAPSIPSTVDWEAMADKYKILAQDLTERLELERVLRVSARLDHDRTLETSLEEQGDVSALQKALAAAEATNKALVEELAARADPVACTVCSDKLPNIVLFPCLHLALCEGCHANLAKPHKCPVCRGDERGFIQVYNA